MQAGAGVELHARPGDAVRAGQPLMTLHTDTPERFDRARAALEGGWAVAGLDEDAAAALRGRSVVLDRIG